MGVNEVPKKECEGEKVFVAGGQEFYKCNYPVPNKCVWSLDETLYCWVSGSYVQFEGYICNCPSKLKYRSSCPELHAQNLGMELTLT